MSENTLERRFYSIKEFKLIYGLGHTTTYRLINEGMLKTVKVGRRTLIPVSSLDALDKQLLMKSVS